VFVVQPLEVSVADRRILARGSGKETRLPFVLRSMSELHEDFSPEISALQESRASLTPSELDRVKTRVRRRTQRTGTWRSFARTRGAVVAALSAGILMTSGGTAMGISGLASSGVASVAQYSPGVSSQSSGSTPSSAVSPAEATQQPVVTSSGSLPFTGFAAIPVLLVGLALVGVGLVGRRASRRDHGVLPR
jgi:hypothetical protein